MSDERKRLLDEAMHSRALASVDKDKRQERRTTIYGNPEALKNVRELAATLGFFLPEWQGAGQGNVSMFVSRMGEAYGKDPVFVSNTLSEMLQHIELGAVVEKYV